MRATAVGKGPVRAARARETQRGRVILSALRERIQAGKPFVLAFDGDRGAWLGPVDQDPAFSAWVHQVVEKVSPRD